MNSIRANRAKGEKMTAHRHAELKTKWIDNPAFLPAHHGESWNPQRYKAVVNARESAVASMVARGVLNRAQEAAADKFRLLWELMGGAGAGALDYSKEPVDGGGARDPIAERHLHAGRELKDCRLLLGARNYDLVSRVCGEGRAFLELAGSRRERDTMADNLRNSLDDLCGRWNLGPKR